MRAFLKRIAAAIRKLLRRERWVDVKVTDPPPRPLSHRDVEHQQQQIKAASSHGVVQGPHDPALCDLCAEGKCSGFGAPVNRRASTVRPGRRKPGTLGQ